MWLGLLLKISSRLLFWEGYYLARFCDYWALSFIVCILF